MNSGRQGGSFTILGPPSSKAEISLGVSSFILFQSNPILDGTPVMQPPSCCRHVSPLSSPQHCHVSFLFCLCDEATPQISITLRRFIESFHQE